MRALGIIETVGLTAAMAALDGAVKTAAVELIGIDKVIGVDKAVSVVLYLEGGVSDVRTAVEAAAVRARAVGKIAGAHVIARPHDELDKIIARIVSGQKPEDKALVEETDKENTSRKKRK